MLNIVPVESTVPVLNNGYVRLVDSMGSDLSVVNAARASFQKESDYIFRNRETGEVVDVSSSEWVENRHYKADLKDEDKRLIKFLAKHGHTSPFRHAILTFEVKAPLMIARQWWKYVVGSDHTMDGWNEVSRRYVTVIPDFYIPDVWRSAPENRKQGSGGPVDGEIQLLAHAKLIKFLEDATTLYDWALEQGICAEQARGFLPANFENTIWRWTASLQSVGHLLNQRLEHSSQWEFQQFAKAIYKIAQPLFPYSIGALVEYTVEDRVIN